MKKRFLANDNAASLWNEFEENEAIQIVGGTSSVSSCSEVETIKSDLKEDCTITIWSKSF